VSGSYHTSVAWLVDCVYMSIKLRDLCVDLQSLGVRFSDKKRGRRGGAGPAEGRVIVINGHFFNAPARSWFVGSSPYEILANDGIWMLYKNGTAVTRVDIPQRPSYYNYRTRSGISAEKIALLHGKDCLASTVYQNCVYWKTPSQCLFCGIGLSLESRATVLMKKPAELGYVASLAYKNDNIRHVTLTGGALADQDAAVRHLIECAMCIKQAAALSVHAQIYPPVSLEYLDRIREAGVDTVGIHIETWPYARLQTIAPCKARVGFERFVTAWKHAVKIFGRNQVSSFIIAGLDEKDDDIRSAAEFLAKIGVFPYLLPLRPIPGTALERRLPPSAQRMKCLYMDVTKTLKKYNLSSMQSMAGCVKCGACSSLRLFEQVEKAETHCFA